MQPVVETLSEIERRVDVVVPTAEVEKQAQARLKDYAKKVKRPGFRPGKVPLSLIEREFGASMRSEVLGDCCNAAFSKVIKDTGVRFAGVKTFERVDERSTDAEHVFQAVFEVFPEISLPDFSAIETERFSAQLEDSNIDKTIEILRQQRASYTEDNAHVLANNDRVTIDFEGKIDGELFEGGSSTDYSFILGQGAMLPDFEAAIVGMRHGEQKTFPVQFPETYGSDKVAGKTAQFTVTIKKVESAVLPTIDSDFAQELGQADGNVEALKADIRKNLEREMNDRVMAKTKAAVFDVLEQKIAFTLPQSLVQQEIQQRMQAARQNLMARGIPEKDVNSFPMNPDMFKESAEKRVRLGLIIDALVEAEKLQPTQEQVRAKLEHLAQSYEDPSEVIQYFISDKSRIGEIEAMVLEENVVQHVLSKSKVTDTAVDFDTLMGKA